VEFGPKEVSDGPGAGRPSLEIPPPFPPAIFFLFFCVFASFVVFYSSAQGHTVNF